MEWPALGIGDGTVVEVVGSTDGVVVGSAGRGEAVIVRVGVTVWLVEASFVEVGSVTGAVENVMASDVVWVADVVVADDVAVSDADEEVSAAVAVNSFGQEGGSTIPDEVWLEVSAMVVVGQCSGFESLVDVMMEDVAVVVTAPVAVLVSTLLPDEVVTADSDHGSVLLVVP
jgi:hypothetical protein